MVICVHIHIYKYIERDVCMYVYSIYIYMGVCMYVCLEYIHIYILYRRVCIYSGGGVPYIYVYFYIEHMFTRSCVFCLTLYQSLLRPKVYTTMSAHVPFGMPRSTQKGFPPTGG